MTIVRWDPIREISSIQGEMNRLFNTYFEPPAPGGSNGGGRRWLPAMDLVEDADTFILRADLPGVNEDDVKLEVEGGVLTVSGERTTEDVSDETGVHRLERAHGSFTRSLTLPDGVDAEGIVATFDRGVLEVRVPKPEEKKPRKVSISVGGRPGTIEAETTS
jgi:HSP20 family protein